uniref:Uncharacterized protein n=1 Tax=Hemiselmis andersenii TaxID=464988 RepID=A0A6T8PNM8_HEMAN|mmetsp:Transcript_21590/g.50075  ORF Transcript_21590/g.50075 Transcript_21590/m.50075 type:complete len:482 (+) Transcript_21590:583-2028(+)
MAHVGGEAKTFTSDALIVATGSNHVPNKIDLPGFSGSLVHSSEYQGPDAYRGRNVLLVGTGESAADVALEVSKVANKVTIWARRPFFSARRYQGGAGAEYMDYDEDRMSKAPKRRQVFEFLEQLTTSRLGNLVPMWLYARMRYTMFKSLLTHPNPVFKLAAKMNQRFVLQDFYRQEMSGAVTKNWAIPIACSTQKAEVVLGDKVTFRGGKMVFPDAVIMSDLDEVKGDIVRDVDDAVACTGYRIDLSWLKGVEGFQANPRTWYKHCFVHTGREAAGTGAKLMFLGWTRPHQGGIPPCSEMLARYAALVLSGERKLPRGYKELALKEGEEEQAFYYMTPNVKTLVDYPAFMHAVARLIGCNPVCPSIFQPTRLVQYLTFPMWPIWFRSQGPGARPGLLDEVLSKFSATEGIHPTVWRPWAKGHVVARFNWLAWLVQKPVSVVFFALDIVTFGWTPLREVRKWVGMPKMNMLHGNDMRISDLL